MTLERNNDEGRYQTVEGEENVESTTSGEYSGESTQPAIEVIETSDVIIFFYQANLTYFSFP